MWVVLFEIVNHYWKELNEMCFFFVDWINHKSNEIKRLSLTWRADCAKWKNFHLFISQCWKSHSGWSYDTVSVV